MEETVRIVKIRQQPPVRPQDPVNLLSNNTTSQRLNGAVTECESEGLPLKITVAQTKVYAQSIAAKLLATFNK